MNTQVRMRRAVLPLDEVDVTLEFPDVMSLEEFEDFRCWLDLILRKAKRSIQHKKPIDPTAAVDAQDANI